MTHDRIERYLAELATRLAETPDEEREARLLEVRSHLEELYERRRAEDPSRSDDETAMAVLGEFGDVDEVAGAPSPAPEVAPWWRRREGRRALLVAGSAVLLLLAVVVAVDVFEDKSSRVVLDRFATYDGQTDVVTDTFVVGDRFDRVEVYVNITRAAGCGGIRLVAPSGEVVLDDRDNCSTVEYTRTFTERGTWTLETHVAAFRGTIFVIAAGGG